LLGAEADGIGRDGLDPGVRDADAVRVATEVADDVLGPAEGPLGVDDPARAVQAAEEGGVVGDGQIDPAVVDGGAQGREHLAAEQRAHDVDREQKLATGGSPAVAGDVEPAAGHDAVQVRMPAEAALPG